MWVLAESHACLSFVTPEELGLLRTSSTVELNYADYSTNYSNFAEVSSELYCNVDGYRHFEDEAPYVHKT
jgi:hypothetical protein